MFVLCVAAAVFIVWIAFSFRNSKIYRLGNFPSPPGIFLVGHSFYINSTKKFLPYLHENLIKHNGIIKVHIGLYPILCVSNTEFLRWILSSQTLIEKSHEYKYVESLLGDGLLLGSGNHWKFHRKLLTPGFHFRMLENHIEALQEICEKLKQKFERKVGEDSFNIYPLITSFSLDAVCESAMATSINAQDDDSSDFVAAMHHVCRIFLERSTDITKMYDIIFRFLADYKHMNESVETIRRFDESVIRRRRCILETSHEKTDDEEKIYERRKTPFIDILLTAKNENNEPLTDEEIKNEANTIMFAGYETSASAISFVLYNLANHVDIQNEAYEEQKRIFGGEYDPTIAYAQINEMKYLDMVIKETLRLHPPIPVIGRRVHEDTFYDGKLLPKGLSVCINLYSLHRDPKLYPEPEKFNPKRFENDFMKPYTYLPFSAGPRNCIGQRFAVIEIKQAVSTILRNFELLPAFPMNTIELVGETSLKSANGIHIGLRKR